MEITRSARGSPASFPDRRTTAFHPDSDFGIEPDGSSSNTRSDCTMPARPIFSSEWNAWTDSAAGGSQSPLGRVSIEARGLRCQQQQRRPGQKESSPGMVGDDSSPSPPSPSPIARGGAGIRTQVLQEPEASGLNSRAEKRQHRRNHGGCE